MSLFSWLRNGMRSAPATRRRTQTSSRQRATFQPQLESLEDRCVPSTLTVTNTADNPIGSPLVPGSLRYEIAQAQSGDTIAFDKRLSGQTITLRGSELFINKNLNIQGLGDSNLAISGGNQSRVFEVAAGVQVGLSGMKIENGDGLASNSPISFEDPGWDDGGGILNWGTLTLSGDTLSGNNAGGNGGGIANDGGTVTITSGSTLSGNGAYNGAGIYNGGTMTLSGSTVTKNTTDGGAGGGIYNDQGANLTILNRSVVEGNSPDDVFNLGTWTHKQSKIGTVTG